MEMRLEVAALPARRAGAAAARARVAGLPAPPSLLGIILGPSAARGVRAAARVRRLVRVGVMAAEANTAVAVGSLGERVVVEPAVEHIEQGIFAISSSIVCSWRDFQGQVLIDFMLGINLLPAFFFVVRFTASGWICTLLFTSPRQTV